MARDFRKRFWISFVVSIPVLALSPLIRGFLGLEALAFAGDTYLVFLLATFVFLYGGSPFFGGLWSELRQ